MKKANDFKLKDKDAKVFSLKDFKSEYLILYFYPKDNTPGCTLEAIDFSKNIDLLRSLGADVIGISGGDEKSKKKFCEKNKLNITLLSDTDFKVSDSYGVYGEKSFMGRKYMGISRSTFILNKKREIIKVFENVKPLGHSKEIISFLKEQGR